MKRLLILVAGIAAFAATAACQAVPGDAHPVPSAAGSPAAVPAADVSDAQLQALWVQLSLAGFRTDPPVVYRQGPVGGRPVAYPLQVKLILPGCATPVLAGVPFRAGQPVRLVIINQPAGTTGPELTAPPTGEEVKRRQLCPS